MKTTAYRAWTALAVIALTSTALAGCGSGSSSSASSASATASASSPASSGVRLLDKGDEGSGSDDGSSASPSASPSPSASASSSAGASTELAEPAAPPAGYQTVTAETARVSVAIPEDWYVYSTLDEAEINEMATRTGADPAELKKATTFQDVVALSPGRDANNVQEIFNCALLAYEKEVVSEETMTDDVNKAGGTVIKYSTVETANGTGSYIIYSPADSPEYASSQLALPNPQGSMVRMNVYSGSTERTQELIDNIAASLR